MIQSYKGTAVSHIIYYFEDAAPVIGGNFVPGWWSRASVWRRSVFLFSHERLCGRLTTLCLDLRGVSPSDASQCLDVGWLQSWLDLCIVQNRVGMWNYRFLPNASIGRTLGPVEMVHPEGKIRV